MTSPVIRYIAAAMVGCCMLSHVPDARSDARSAAVMPVRAGLFGSREFMSADLSAFGKWTSMLARAQAQMASPAPESLLSLWRRDLAALQSQPRAVQIRIVNETLNQLPFVADIDNYGRDDYWATPAELFALGGDCEDYAIAKYASLRALGFAADAMRIVIVADRQDGGRPHAVLAVDDGGDTYILDNQSRQVLRAADVTRYAPVFSINARHWWRHLSL